MAQPLKHIIPAVILLLSAACNSDDPAMGNGGNSGNVNPGAGNADGEISFAVNDQSRAVATFGNSNLPDYFMVWAKWNNGGTTNIPIAGDEVSSDGNGGFVDQTATRYWPDNGTMDFYAVTDRNNRQPGGSLRGTSMSATADGFALYYTVNSDAAQQGDLVYAVKTGQKWVDDADNTVKFDFSHALSRVSFKIKSEYSKYVDVYLRKITIEGANSKGKCEITNSGCTWSSSSAPGTFTATLPDGGFMFNAEGGMVEVGGDEKENSYFMMIPQEAEELTVTITIAFKAQDNGVSVLPQFSDERTFSSKIKNVKWETARSYSYSLTLTAPDHFNINGHEAVLMRENPPLYMGTENLKNAAGEGLYFWWGDTEGHVAGADFEYKISNDAILTQKRFDKKYDENEPDGLYKFACAVNGNPDDIILRPEYDAATKMWNSPWHAPTYSDLYSIIKYDYSLTRVYDDGAKFHVVSLYTYDYVTVEKSGIYGNKLDLRTTWLQGSEAQWLSHSKWVDVLNENGNPVLDENGKKVQKQIIEYYYDNNYCYPVYASANSVPRSSFYKGYQIRPFATPPAGTKYEVWPKTPTARTADNQIK